MSVARIPCMCASLVWDSLATRSNLRVSRSRARKQLSTVRRLGPRCKLGGSTSLVDLPPIFQDFPDRSTPSFVRYLESQHMGRMITASFSVDTPLKGMHQFKGLVKPEPLSD